MLPISPADLSPNSEYLRSLQTQAEAEGRECIVGGLVVQPHRQVFVQKRSAERALFPGGHVEPGEILYAALAREIAEETGWQLRRIVAVVEIFDWETVEAGQIQRKREFDFLAEVAGELGQPQIEADKFSEYRWVGEAELEVLLENRAAEDRVVFRLARRALDLVKP